MEKNEWWGEGGEERMWRGGGCQLGNSLTGCAPAAQNTHMHTHTQTHTCTYTHMHTHCQQETQGQKDRENKPELECFDFI